MVIMVRSRQLGTRGVANKRSQIMTSVIFKSEKVEALEKIPELPSWMTVQIDFFFLPVGESFLERTEVGSLRFPNS
jgi:hypothetical protein